MLELAARRWRVDQILLTHPRLGARTASAMALLAALLGGCAVDRWHDQPVAHYAEAGWNVQVQAIATGADSYDLRATSLGFHLGGGDPLEMQRPFRAAALARAAELCGEKTPVIVHEAQMQPYIDLFVQVRCEAR